MEVIKKIISQFMQEWGYMKIFFGRKGIYALDKRNKKYYN